MNSVFVRQYEESNKGDDVALMTSNELIGYLLKYFPSNPIEILKYKIEVHEVGTAEGTKALQMLEVII